ncbi:HD domain-containing protein [Desulfosudis oleivorans]|nr:hypothetical protein [Desulfosudis oleivorans]
MHILRLVEKTVSSIEEINDMVASASKGRIIVFHRNSHPTPTVEIPIHGFFTTISWLYIMYFELPNTTLNFLQERAHKLGVASEESIQRHMKCIHDFRTCCQHNLKQESKEDIAKEARCLEWIRFHINDFSNTSIWIPPSESEIWSQLLHSLFTETYNFLNILSKTTKEIVKDVLAQDTFEILLSRIEKFFHAHEWDRIVRDVINDLGMEYLDISNLRSRHFEKWNKQLSILSSRVNIQEEARKIVEHTIIKDSNIPLPITGRDIIAVLNIPPGPEIRAKLKEAEELFFKSPCGREELLAQLKSEE